MAPPNSLPRKRKAFLILDPHDSYGVEIARYAALSLGVRAIALFSDAKMRAFFRSAFPEIESDLFEARENLDGRSLVDVTEELAEHYEIIGVAPYLEYHLEQFAPVIERLGLTWNPAAAIARCRDKHALKSFLSSQGVDVPRTLSVRTLAEAKAARATLGTFVLKPNAGYSNQHIGFFGPTTDDDTLAAHLDPTGEDASGQFVAEAYVGGQEFSLNGQVDEHGTAHLLSIFTGERTFANGRESVYRHAWQLRSDDDRFEMLKAYAFEVMAALGLRAIPFHLEVRLDANGRPKLVDVGARVIGNELAFMLGRLHQGAFNALHLATRGYLGLSCAPPLLDFAASDARTFVRVYGIARREETIATLRGVEETEARPEFVRWVQKPTIGKHLVPTLDLNTLPYAVDFLVDGPESDGRTLAHAVEAAIKWNHPAPTLAERANATRQNLIDRARPKARIALEQLTAGHAPQRRQPPESPAPTAPASSPHTPAHSPPSSSFSGGVKDGLKQGLKENLWPALRHIVPREAPPDLDRWDLRVNASGRLEYEGVDIADLCEHHGSPLHVVLDGVLRKNASAFQSASSGAKIEVAFSYKTNPVPSVCSRLHALGIGAECISPYELWLALKLGTPPDEIIYGGPAKSDASLEIAIEREIKLLNINHPEEIERVERAARKVGKRARVGLRVTPPGGWTGQFGASIETGEARKAFERALSSDVLDVVGLHVHRGMLLRSQDEIDGYLGAVLPFATALVTDLGIALEYLDLGGSLAIPTVASFSKMDRRLAQTFLADQPPPDAEATVPISQYVQTVATRVARAFEAEHLEVPTVLLEPGRALTGSSQLLLTKVVTTKEGRHAPPHAVMDGGINVAEPAQFEYHRAVCANRASAPDEKTWRLVGPACTPGDILYTAWAGPQLHENDVLAVLDAGAYFVPFSTTFSFPRPGIVSIVDGEVHAMRRAETFDDLVSRDAI